jgi:ubiquinone biosynthesis protein
MMGLKRVGIAQLNGEFLSQLFEALGGTFVKMGQIISSRPDVFAPEVIASLQILQDDSNQISIRKIQGVLSAAYPLSPTKVFKTFEVRPIASASVAQVHRAILHDGRQVVVKVRRPGIRRTIKNDINLVTFLVSLVESLPNMDLIPFREVLNQFNATVEGQLDFRSEAARHRQFHDNLCQIEKVIIPRIYEELCTDSVLVMEFIDELERVGKLTYPAEMRQQVALRSLEVVYTMLFVNGLVHCDMHPGNVFVRHGDEFVVLDFGFSAILTEQDKMSFAEFFLAMAMCDGKRCAQIAYRMASFTSTAFNWQKFEEAMVDLIRTHSTMVAREFEVTVFAGQLFQLQRTHGLKGTASFTMAIVALVVYEGIAKQIYADLDFQQEARKFIPLVIRPLAISGKVNGRAAGVYVLPADT